MARPNPFRDLTYLLGVIVAVAVIATLYLARVVLVPFALAMLFSFLLTPVVTWLEHIRLPRVFAVMLVVLVFIAAMGSVGWTVTNQLIAVTTQLPRYEANIKNKINSIRNPKGQSLNKATDAVVELGKELAAAPAGDPADPKRAATNSPSPDHPLPVEIVSPSNDLLQSVGSVLGSLGTLGIVIVFTIFILMRREDLRNRFIRLTGSGRLNLMTQALDEAGRRVSRYVFLQFLVNTCYGLVIGVALYFIGVPNSMLWGAGAGLLRFLPYIGPPLGALLPVLFSIAMFDGWTRTLITVGVFVSVEIVVSSFIEPVLYGAHTGISALAILFAAVFWVLLWGPIGLVLSTPLTVCLVVMARHVPRLAFLQVILGDEPVLPPEAQFYQRLLATDQNEARQVLEEYLKDKPLEDLYDLVLIPALSLAEQDRHRNELDEATQLFIFQSIKELLEEINDTDNELLRLAAKDADESASGNAPGEPPQNATANRANYVVCIPARDEADEIVGIMLAHLLERAGFPTRSLEIGTTAEMLAQVLEEKTAVVCISALPPFAVGHARRVYHGLRAQSPDLNIVIGLWNISGDSKRAANRIAGSADVLVFRTLAQTIQQIRFQASVTPVATDPAR